MGRPCAICVLQIAKLVLYIVFSAHWVCCAWYAVGTYKSDLQLDLGFNSVGWVHNTFGATAEHDGNYDEFGDIDPSKYLLVKYLYSMYYAILALVAADLPAETELEVMFGSGPGRSGAVKRP